MSEVIELYLGREIPLWPAWELAWTMHIALFHDPGIEDAKHILNDVELLNTTWNREVKHLIVHNYSLERPTNKLLLNSYFSAFNLSKDTPYDTSDELFASVFIGADYLLNDKITYESLNVTITKDSGRSIPLHNISADISGGNICVLFFHSPTCGDCHKARSVLEHMKDKYPDLDVRGYNTANLDNEVLKQSYFEYYNVPQSKQGTLAIFIADEYFVDIDLIEKEIEDVIKDNMNGCECPEVEPDKEIVKEKFTSFTLLAVIGGGLIDGINPCAFATLIFFIGYLWMTGRTKKQILIIGLGFTLGVFFTYFILGVGIYSFLASSSSVVKLLSMWLFPIMGIFALCLGFYSIYDYMKARKGKKEEMKLQLPKPVKRLIGRVIKHQVQLKYFALIAILTGIVISILEFMCTGQVYLPTIMVVVATVPEYQFQAILLLLLYNLMFILPLVIIFTVVYFGMSSEQLQVVLDRNRPLFKLLTAIVFFVLGLFLIWYSWEFIF